jgi:DNA-binding protein H-NS
MARESYAALQAKIEKEINKLQKKSEVLQTRRRKPVIASIVASMREYGIALDEIAAAFGSGKATNATKRPVSKKANGTTATKRPVAPKYRHPTSGETWSGRGKAPRWLVAAEAAGSQRGEFLIK